MTGPEDAPDDLSAADPGPPVGPSGISARANSRAEVDDDHGPAERRRRPASLGDFTLTPRVLLVCAWAVPIGALGAGSAWVLLRLIGLITHLVFYGTASAALVSPGLAAHPWWLVLGAPVAGGLVVGVMARYGSEKIRGHGMPEAIEAILTRGSRVEPKVAVFKPISAAVSIGTGGPFGAEGPIIMTGGALGSILAQYLNLSAGERKALMVGGAAAGMTATFNAPLASALLAVELLLFEWRPRSFLPVATAVAVATLLRAPLLGAGPIFPVDTVGWHITGLAELLCVVTGAVGGLLAVAVTALVYFSEDSFARLESFRVAGHRLGLHWMWWPALGGLVIGLGGLVEPRALGVGYDVIDALLTGQATLALVVGILVVKSLIWGLSLGSGTSGGVLAPVFMIGAALGALEAHVLPAAGTGFWALIGLAAVVGGVMRSPFTGVVFSLELTHAWPALLALLIASGSAYAVSALLLKRSVLTEKIARRGLHLSREYDVDPLEVLFVDEVMHSHPAVLRPDDPLPAPHAVLAATVPRPGRAADPVTAATRPDAAAPPPEHGEPAGGPPPGHPSPLGGGPVGPIGPVSEVGEVGEVGEVRQRLFPVVDHDGHLVGILAREQLERALDPAPGRPTTVAAAMLTEPVVVGPDDTLRQVRERFATTGITAAPVVAPAEPATLTAAGGAAVGDLDRPDCDCPAAGPTLLGLITVEHLLDGRLPNLAEEHHRVRARVPRPALVWSHRRGAPPPPRSRPGAAPLRGRPAAAGTRNRRDAAGRDTT